MGCAASRPGAKELEARVAALEERLAEYSPAVVVVDEDGEEEIIYETGIPKGPVPTDANDLKEWRKTTAEVVFQAADKNNDEKLTVEEIKEYLTSDVGKASMQLLIVAGGEDFEEQLLEDIRKDDMTKQHFGVQICKTFLESSDTTWSLKRNLSSNKLSSNTCPPTVSLTEPRRSSTSE